MTHQFLDFGLASIKNLPIHTLGQSGTSSEYVAHFFSDWVSVNYKSTHDIYLHDSYEQARNKVVDSSGLLLVANAYSKVNNFYMDSRLKLISAFVYNTPLYGIASNGVLPDKPLVISSHPAPIPLIKELLPKDLVVAKIIEVSSTDTAAKAVALGNADIALTNEVASQMYKLNFISKTRPINMLWSVFISDIG